MAIATGGGERRPRRAGSAVAAPPAGTLSYTSLSELERCGYRYYVERVLGLPEDRAAEAQAVTGRGGLDARARGTLIHRLLESVDFARPRPVSEREVAAAARELGVRAGDDERAQIARLIGDALAAQPAVRVAAATSVRREQPFAFAAGEDRPLVTGVIDLVAREAGGNALVLDYKSDRVGGEEDLEALVRRDYAVQRELYALALLRGGAASVEVVHWFLERPHEWAGARYAPRDRDALERRLGERVARVRERRFEVSSHPHRGLCLTCPARAGLCSWGEEDTLRENPPSARIGRFAH